MSRSVQCGLQSSHQEGMISLVAIEQSQPGQVTATLRLDSNLEYENVPSDSVRPHYHRSYLYNIILIEHTVILAVELLDIVDDPSSGTIGRDTGSVAQPQEVHTATLLVLVRGQAEAAGAVLLLPALAVPGGLQAGVVRNPAGSLSLQEIQQT